MARAGTRLRIAWVAAAVILATLLAPSTPVGLAQTAAPPPGCPAPMPVDQVTSGTRGTGLTVSRGTTIEPFSVTVVDVLQDAVAPGYPLIVVEVDSPEIRRVGGIWGGMSGSPVTIDGRLLGAISYGFSLGPSSLAGVTPAGAMYEVATRGVATANAARAASVPMPGGIQRMAVADGLAAAQATSMTPLPLPVTLAGPTGTLFARLAGALEQAHPGVRVVAGAGAAGAGTSSPPIQAGGNLVASLAVGDVTAMGAGTATAVCDPSVYAFGHPLVYEGSVDFGLHGGSVVRVVDDPTTSPYKLVNAGPVAGRIQHDRLAGVAGRLGAGPSGTAITSRITNADDARRVDGRTDAYLPDQVDWLALSHVALNYDVKAFDDPTVSGTAEARWVLEGTRAGGRSWTVTRTNRYASDGGLSWAASVELADTLGQLLRNPFELVRVTSVDYQATASTPYRAYRVDPSALEIAVGQSGFQPAGTLAIEITPGADVRLRVPLIAYRGERRTVEVALRVPPGAAGFGDLTVVGGADLAAGEECLSGECDTAASDLDGLLADIPARPRGDDLVVRLWVGAGEEPSGPATEEPDAEVRLRLDQVVGGSAFVPVVVGADVAACDAQTAQPFVDVSPTSVHGPAIACAAALGLVRGVTSDPPTYQPAAPVRRDAAASFVLRALELAGVVLPEAPPVPRFGDLDGNVHADAIERSAAAGIVQGRAPGTFDPRADVTRQQLATMLVAALRVTTDGELTPTAPAAFPDVSGPHAEAVAVAAERGLMVGRADGRFWPAAATRRDQVASVLLRLVAQP